MMREYQIHTTSDYLIHLRPSPQMYRCGETRAEEVLLCLFLLDM